MQRLMRLLWRPSGESRRKPMPLWMRRTVLGACALLLFAGYLAGVAQATRSGWVGAQIEAVGQSIDAAVADLGFRIASVKAYGANQTEAAELREVIGVEPGARCGLVRLGAV